MDLSLSIEVILMLTAVAAVAGFIDAIAGGGGLLTIPAMLLANIPPVLTLGTNKLQAASGALAASITMIHRLYLWLYCRAVVTARFIRKADSIFDSCDWYLYLVCAQIG